jgi:hypothetical protein
VQQQGDQDESAPLALIAAIRCLYRGFSATTQFSFSRR